MSVNAEEMLSWFFIINAAITVVVIILERRRPEKTVAWLIIFAAFPPLGFVLYLLVGRNWKRHKLNEEFSPYVKELVYKEMHHIENPDYIPLVKLLAENSDSPIFVDNSITIFRSGDEKFEALINEMKKAKHHIHLEYYMIKSDNIGNKIIDVLLQKAKEGVKVRLILDRMGSVKFSKKRIKELKENGVDIVQYTYVLAPILRNINTSINYRNHRKIAVIDGRVGFVGGMNIGDEYCGKGKLGYWRDSHIMVKGDFVLGLQGVFIDDFIATKKAREPNYVWTEDFDEYFPEPLKADKKTMQLVTSGPDSMYPSIMHAVLKMIAMAKDHIYITTPYFVPPESVMEALRIAALSGVKIKLIFPGTFDHFFVYYASRSYFSELLKCGVEIYLYRKDSFIHSKTMMVDGKIVTVGTANMDIRSYELNYEVNAVIYDNEITKEFEDGFMDDISQSELLTLEKYEKTPKIIKFIESFSRIFSELL